MVPQSIELKNFLSYRGSSELDLHGIHLACITGANGAGKSSLLDAMTWALFGQSRSKSDDNIVNRLAAAQGEAAEVKFTFNLENVTYRIIRSKQVGKAMSLEFQVATGDSKWKPLSESRLRDTQAGIESLLKMNFDTFVNSSFLLQGKADEFTTKTPNRRKEILAELLGVDEWNRYKEVATARRKEVETDLILVDGRLNDIQSELAEEPERKAALMIASDNLEQISERLKVQELLLDEARRSEAARKQQEQTVKNLAGNVSRTESTLAKQSEIRTKRQKQRDEYQLLLDRSQSIAAGYVSWQKADKLAKDWQAKADKYNSLQQEIRPHELALERERSRLGQRKTELEEVQQKIDRMREERSSLSGIMDRGKKELTALDYELARLSKMEGQWQQERDKLQKLVSNRDLLEQEANQLRDQVKQINKQKLERDSVSQNLLEAEVAVEKAAAELEIANAAYERMMGVMAESDILKADQRKFTESMELLKDRIEQLEAESGSECPLCGQALSEEHRRSVLSKLKADGKRDGDQYRQNQSDLKDFKAEIGDLRIKVKQKEHLEREQQAQQQRQATAAARLEEFDRSIGEWEKTGAKRLQVLEAELTDIEAIKTQEKIVSDLQDSLKQKEKSEQERQSLQGELTKSDARSTEIERAIVIWEGEEPEKGQKAELRKITKQLSTGDFAPEAKSALEELEKRVSALGYDAAAHQASARHVEELAEAQELFHQLERAEAAVKELEETLADLDRQISDQEIMLAEQIKQHEEAVAHLAILTEDGVDLAVVEREVLGLREEEIGAHRRVATAQQHVKVLDSLSEELGKVTGEREEITQLIKRLKVLEKACGREGVQALLIERALPEIEDDANQLLERLTGGQMQVTFETQRKLKTSDRIAETLDIHITDNAGERPYENFSGGEQFRVNFAIRLALSKILTRRAGSRLQTLVVDEGFGSQDPEGRQRLIEAINIIQHDFERILVITHIDEMRDSFPVRIEVEKSLSGSTIAII